MRNAEPGAKDVWHDRVMDDPLPLAHAIAEAARARGGRALVVGGYVRDLLLGLASNDIDLELYGIPEADVLPLLAAFGSPLEPPVVRTPDGFSTNPEDRVLTRVVGPVWTRVRTAAGALRTLQQGRVTTYLQYIVFTLLLLLGVLFLSSRRP